MRDLVLPEELRGLLKKPFGKVYKGKGLKPAKEIKKVLKGEKVIVVGDRTFKNMLEVGVTPSLAIVDLKTKRKIKEEFKKTEGRYLQAKNPAGMITEDLWDKIHEGLKKDGTILLVDGEEDLAVLPCIIEADWDSIILYGQPDEGIVLVRVDEDKKFDAGSIIKLMMDREKWQFQGGI
jgi:hypothetical protein